MISSRGTHAPSRAGFGALAETISLGKIRDREAPALPKFTSTS
jgi:hypothetical protein